MSIKALSNDATARAAAAMPSLRMSPGFGQTRTPSIPISWRNAKSDGTSSASMPSKYEMKVRNRGEPSTAKRSPWIVRRCAEAGAAASARSAGSARSIVAAVTRRMAMALYDSKTPAA
jgi:hypothetical protein